MKSEATLTLSFWLGQSLKLGEKLPAQIPADFFILKKNSAEEILRRIGARLGGGYNTVSIDLSRVLEQQAKIKTFTENIFNLQPDTAPSKFLLRVDDFPSAFAKSEDFQKFHEIARSFDIPYLLAVTPFHEGQKLSSKELVQLRQYASENVEIALHGFTHQRVASAIPSELLGMTASALKSEVQKSKTFFLENGLNAQAFVAPFNSYDPATVEILAEEFSILCGGPESVVSMGYRAPSFVGNSLYIPSYRGAYDLKENDLCALKKAQQETNGLIIPITLHWANELKDDSLTFKHLCKIIQPNMMSWKELLEKRNTLV